jgi:S-adenosylmethionine:tRNA ribosyltransferase-isomerase
LIAQRPARQRDQSRLLVLDRASGKLSHHQFPEILDYLRPGDLLVLNNSKVIPARLRATISGSGGDLEVLLLEENGLNDWWAMIRPGKRARLQSRLDFKSRRHGSPTAIHATVIELNNDGHRRLQFSGTPNVFDELNVLGEVPLPPYIQRDTGADLAEDLVRYQTVYAETSGSVAAPTAGLHFTQELLERIRQRGVQVCSVTLHVGAGTFAPVKAASLSEHVMHEERYAVGEATAQAINSAGREGRRVIAVGTTAARVLESVASAHHGKIVAGTGRTRLFIHPPYHFHVANALLTNFHLPRSTLLMLVSAFAAPGETRGPELVLAAYAEAVRERYRFFSYGDAMLII